ncbi:MAG: signal recognition particle-docking protein FtsY [Hahellaceae bacterium]|nr:signal recognition particle-docking protein FtsY [Hahellaceae bacterium]
MTMDAILFNLTTGLTGFLFLIWVIDSVVRRSRRPRHEPFSLREAPPSAAAQKGPPAPIEKGVSTAAAKPAPSPPGTDGERLTAPSLTWVERVRSGLSKTRANFSHNLSALFTGGRKVDAELMEELETLLLTADVGISATTEILDAVTQKQERKQLGDAQALQAALKQELNRLLVPCTAPLQVEGRTPYVMLVVGVNGVGKTTTIGKMAKYYQQAGKSVLLAAGDTFRAAAVEQLQVWGERNNVPVVAQHTGADSASVIYDAIQAAKSRQIDLVIADTAGRLQTKDNLMSELEKVVRVIRKHDPEAPHEVLLVLDAGTGQNALSQAQLFREAVGVSGLAITKLDGTAKGGIVFAIAKQHPLPIRFIGVGESIDDLKPFDADTYIQALFD